MLQFCFKLLQCYNVYVASIDALSDVLYFSLNFVLNSRYSSVLNSPIEFCFDFSLQFCFERSIEFCCEFSLQFCSELLHCYPVYVASIDASSSVLNSSRNSIMNSINSLVQLPGMRLINFS
jgi:hypothetical protein